MMRSGLHQVAMTLATLCLCTAATAGDHSKRCSPATLSGTWLLAGTGSTFVGGNWVPKAIVQQMHFGGDGTVIVPVGTVANRFGDGAVTPLAPTALTGTYTLEANCVGTYQIGVAPSFDLYADPDGKEAWMIQTNPNNVFQVKMVKLD